MPVMLDKACDPLTSVLLNNQERHFMNESIRYLNQVIHAAANTAGIGFIDSENSFDGFQLCSSGAPTAMNGLRFGGDIAPIQALPRAKFISSASFHPTAYGHSLLADAIRGRYGDIRTYPWCENGKIVCPHPTTIPEPSDYWSAGRVDTTFRYAQLVKEHIQRGSFLAIESPGWFRSSDTVHATLQSDPIDLGQFSTDEEGRVSETVEIPVTVGGGYHTLTLTGMSSSGLPLTLYQEVAVREPVFLRPQGEGSVEGESSRDNAFVRKETTEPLYAADGTPPTVTSRPAEDRAVLGRTTQRNVATEDAFWWPLAMAPAALVVYLAVKLRRIAYNGTMASIRTIVKKFIPRSLFQKIEPLGHLLEAILINIRYGFPGRKLRIIGVTGTNGKTTTSFMIHRLLHESGIKAGLLTTVANGVGDNIVPQTVHITTAQAGVLQRRLRDYARQGVEWVVVETSSHALAQNRVWGLPYEIAVMTNITHEHLDYHGTFRRYVEAKRRLFKIANRHGLRFGVVNAQDPSAEKFVRTVANHTTYGIGKGQLHAEKVKLSAEGSRYQAKIDEDRYDITVNIPGEFNVSNSLAAIAVGRKLGLTKTEIEKGIAALRSVEGRMNVIDEGQPFKVIVDFASTPDAFERLFESVRPLAKGKLIAVFGSAGRRDEAKRPVQGEVAGRSADIVIVTEEDDRDVDGNQILQEIAKGAKKAKKKEGKDLFLILNREEAIGFAMTQATSKDDVVVLLGKGHEHTIERADGEYPWNEAEVARAALQALKKSSR
jgi:UDP-N-acetylmuramoyl-L-alanyl-D-glutamate--2,6-diaminopimelate ligase